MYIQQITTISFNMPDEYDASVKFEESHKDWLKDDGSTTVISFTEIKNRATNDYTIK